MSELELSPLQLKTRFEVMKAEIDRLEADLKIANEGLTASYMSGQASNNTESKRLEAEKKELKLCLKHLVINRGHFYECELEKDGNFCSCLINDLLKEEKESK